MTFLKFVSLFCIAIIATYTHGQNAIPFVNNYLPIDYNGESQNWEVIQDNRGLMYFGNTKGLLEFDGTYWNFIDPINVFTAKKSKQGIIYLAGNQNYGYLSTNSLGQVKFISLKPKIPAHIKTINDFYSIAIINNTVYFAEHNGRIHIYQNDSIHIIETGFSSLHLANVQNTLFICSKSGLFKLENDRVVEIDSADILKGKTTVELIEFSNKLLIVTRLNGLYFYDGTKAYHWETDVNSFISKNQVYRATKVNEDQIAFGTVENGMLLMNKNGKPVQHINTSGGMVNHDHCAIYTDSWGNVWSGLENGISHIQINSPFSIYNQQSGLNNSAVYSIIEHNNKLFIGTAQGIMYRTALSQNNPLADKWKFKYVENNKGRKAWNMLSYNNSLIATYSNIGTYKIDGITATNITKGNTGKIFISDSSEQYYICSRQHGGILVLKKENGKVRENSTFKFKQQIEYFAKDSLDNFWAFLSTDELVRYTFNSDFSDIISETTYSTSNGLPDNSAIAPFNIGEKLFFGTHNGTYKFNYQTNKFVESSNLNTEHPKLFIYKCIQGKSGKYYFLAKNKLNDIIGEILISANTYQITTTQESLKKITPLEIKSIYEMDSNILLIGCIDRLVEYNKNYTGINNTNFNVLLRSVETITKQDELLYGGSNLNDSIKSKKQIITFSNNALRFKYSAIYYDEPRKIQYSYRLVGYDNHWSNWNTKTEKEYSYLKPGNYTFEVKAKNLYGVEGNKAIYSFHINPPWYRTLLAYIIYLVLLVFIARWILLLSLKKIKNEKIKLEQIVKERTKEIALQNTEIRNKNQTLVSQKTELSHQYNELATHRSKTLDSLRYAEHIQSSLLPTSNLFNDCFNDSFILFRPKDIVSGDFYWLKKVNNHTIFAVGDCTGHGVPGAFMSVIGISFINEIIQQKEITSPAMALELLRSQIKSTLNPELNTEKSHNYIELYLNTTIRDGLDIALCSINNKTKILDYAGANLPILIIRNNAIIELKPTDNPIGVYLIEEPFTNKTFQLETGDLIYLFSDGYYDQFGGPHNKKYYYNNFKKLLLQINQNTGSQQKQKLVSVLDEWQGIAEQIDDITVLGIRI